MPNARAVVQFSLNDRAMGRPRSGFRGLRTLAPGAKRVEALGQPAALTGGGVLVNRSLGRNAIEPLHDLLQSRGRIVGLPRGKRGSEALDRFLDLILAGAVARAALDALTDAFLGGK